MTMASLGREDSLCYGYSRNDSSVGYPGLPEVSTYQEVYPVSSAKFECHVDNVSSEKKTTATTELTTLSETHLTPPPAYQSELCESQRNLAHLEPLRPKHSSTPYASEYEEKSSEPQKFPFWRKKRGIILIVVLSNLIIIAVVCGGVFISRNVASHSTASSKDMATTTEGYTSSTTMSLAPTNLPATIMSATPHQWEPSSDGTQASGNVVDSGNTQSNSDAGGESKGFSGPFNKPGGGLH